MFFLWIYENQFKLKWQIILENKIIFALPLMYLMYLIGMIYSDNTDYGWQKLETKFGILFFPVFLSTFQSIEWKKNYSYYIKTYIYGVIFTAIFCGIRSVVLFSYELYCRENRILLDEYPYTNYFFSSYLSYFMHYGYYAMYVNMAIIFLYELMISDSKKYGYLLSIFSLSVFVLMLYSKAGIMTNFIIHISYIAHIVRRKIFNSKYTFLLVILSLISLGYILFNYIPYTKERINTIVSSLVEKKLDRNSTESTQLRIFAWKASKELIYAKPLFGYGTGDANDALISKYKERNYYGVLSKQLNAHNQYFQTIISIGIIGLLPLIIFFIWFLYLGIKFQNTAMIVFFVIILVVYAFESYLETQAGVFFTCIFPFVLLQKQKA